MKFAIIKTGGKQYKVSPGEKIKIEKIPGEAGTKVIFDKVLLIADVHGKDAEIRGMIPRESALSQRESANEVRIGAPYIDKALVEAEILKTAKDKKKIVFRYHSKNRYRKKKGHRQHYTEVKITDIKGF